MENFFDRMKRHLVDRIWLEVDDMECVCLIVAPNLAWKVPNFVGMLGVRKYFLSSSVPVEFRRAWIAHEMHCFALRDQGHVGYCVHGVRFELEYVPAEGKSDYIALRRQMFAALIKYYKKSGDAAFIQEITASHRYLCSLC